MFEDGGETTLAACFRRGEHRLSGIELTEKRVRTNVAMVHEAGHPEPWIIALSQAPSVHTAFDYGLRWGIEAMFSDFKSRGFGARRQPDQASRTARPPHPGHGVGAVLGGGARRHVGCRPSAHRRRKKPCHARPRSYARSLTSLFKRGLRRIHTCLHLMIPPPHLDCMAHAQFLTMVGPRGPISTGSSLFRRGCAVHRLVNGLKLVQRAMRGPLDLSQTSPPGRRAPGFGAPSPTSVIDRRPAAWRRFLSEKSQTCPVRAR